MYFVMAALNGLIDARMSELRMEEFIGRSMAYILSDNHLNVDLGKIHHGLVLASSKRMTMTCYIKALYLYTVVTARLASEPFSTNFHFSTRSQGALACLLFTIYEFFLSRALIVFAVRLIRITAEGAHRFDVHVGIHRDLTHHFRLLLLRG